jgi:hypothetical protein
MQSAIPLRGYRYNPSFRARATGLALSLATCLLILLMLIKMGAFSPITTKQGPKLTAISLSTQASDREAKTHVAKSLQATPAARKAPEVRPIQPPVPHDTPVPPLRLLKLSRDEFAAADISKMHRSAASGSDDAGSGQGSAAAYGPGEGPGGAKLYRAQWYREPSDAEMATYMPTHRLEPGAWATIACRTEEHYHVADCRELAEFPRGSGLSRAMRQAAWQFLVRPPRLNGRPLIGTWVSIIFEEKAAPVTDEPDPTPN